jgi:hypothetical protein
MQYPSDIPLAAALGYGQDREIRVEFHVDWDRDGLYAHPDSDLSGIFQSARIDRRPNTVLPDALEELEGFLISEMQVTLSGETPTGIPAWKFFSPYAGFTPGSADAINIPCYLDVLVNTSVGEKRIRQFTGVISKPSPSRRQGNVVLSCRDPLAKSTARVNLTPWAADTYQRWPTDYANGNPERSWISLSWLITHCLRASGLYEGPPWSDDAVVAWSLSGAPLPDIGHITTEEFEPLIPWYYNQIPVRVPAGMPTDLWSPGQFGLCYVGAHQLPVPDATLQGAVGGACHTSRYVHARAWGPTSSNVLAFAAVLEIDPSLNGGPWVSSSVFYLERCTGGDPASASRVTASVDHETGATTLAVYDRPSASTRTYTLSSLPSGWLHLTWAVRFTPAGTTAQFYINGAGVAPDASSSTAAIGELSGVELSLTNLARVDAMGRMQYAQWTFTADADFTGWTPPEGELAEPSAVVDLAALALEHIPRRVNFPALDLLQELVSADLGMLYSDEYGVARYDSRYTVMQRRDTALAARIITPSTWEDFTPEPALESVVNSVGYATVRKLAYVKQTVYAGSQPDEHRLAPGEGRQELRAMAAEAQSMRVGLLPYRHLAMGYNELGVSLSWWERAMEYYNPDYWWEGYTPYQPGSRTDPTVQPVPVNGMSARIRIGAADGDFVSGALRMSLFNLSATSGQFSVDDSTAFLRVGGTLIVPQAGDSRAVVDDASVAQFGTRTFDMPGVDWYSDPRTCDLLMASLVSETGQPRASLRSMAMQGDPRTQVQDVLRVDDPDGMMGPAFVSVAGIQRSIDKESGIRDDYAMATVGSPLGSWILDDEVYSILDETTVLG